MLCCFLFFSFFLKFEAKCRTSAWALAIGWHYFYMYKKTQTHITVSRENTSWNRQLSPRLLTQQTTNKIGMQPLWSCRVPECTASELLTLSKYSGYSSQWPQTANSTALTGTLSSVFSSLVLFCSNLPNLVHCLGTSCYTSFGLMVFQIR